MKRCKAALALLLLPLLASTACTDAGWGKLASLGDSAEITCYSGGKQIGSWTSSGKVISEAQSDGYFFRDKKSGHFLEVSGNCIIVYR